MLWRSARATILLAADCRQSRPGSARAGISRTGFSRTGLPRTSLSRAGFARRWIVLPLALIGVALASWMAIASWRGRDNQERSAAMVHPVARGLFEHSIIEPGEVESSNNVEVRCEVQARNSAGTVILEIIPAGTVVKPGDILIKFDGSALENERNQQQIVCNTSAALLIQSRNVLETAQITRQEYLEGTYKQEEQAAQSVVFVAEENLRRAEEYARYTEKLAARGFATAVELEADRFAVEKARKELDAAKTKLKVLQDFTRVKLLKQYDADIKTAEAKLKSDENTHRLDLEKLKLIEAQIEKCVVRSPAAGKVVYANVTDRRGNNEVIIQEGAIIRERQTVIRLPDLTKMQVLTKINESRIGFVRVGMKATVRLDAFPDLELDGVVTRVDEYPVPPGWMNNNIKQYATYVEITSPPPGLRPGLTAQVEIHVDQIPDALAVPIQAIHEHNGQYYCLVAGANGPAARWIDVGASNEQTVVIREGIADGDQVIINPDRFAESLEFPLPPPGRESPAQKPLIASAETAKKSPDGATSSTRSEPAAVPDPSAVVRAMFDQYDKNRDGVLTPDELPAERRASIRDSDSNGDGQLDRAEMTAALVKFPAAGDSAPPAAGGAL